MLSRRTLLAVGSGAVLAAPAFTRGGTRSSIAGHWFARIGAPPEHNEVTLQLEAAPGGGLRAWAWIAALHFQRLELPLLRADPAPGVHRDSYRDESGELRLRTDGRGLVCQGLLDEELRLTRRAGAPAPYREPPMPAGPAPRWSQRIGGAVFATPAVHEGLLIAGTSDGVVIALNARDGSKRWTFSAGRALHGEIGVAGDRLYAVCDNGRLLCLDLDGREQWRHELGDAQVPRIPPNPFVFDYDHQGPKPLVVDDRVIVGSGDGSVHAVDRQRGTAIWRTAGPGKVRADAARLGAQVVVGSTQGLLRALAIADGSETARRELGAAVVAAPVVHGDGVIVGHRGSELLHWVPGEAEPRWRQRWWGAWVESAPVLGGPGEAFIGSGDLLAVSAFDPGNGSTRWRTVVGGWVLQAPLLAGPTVFAALSGARRRPPHFVAQSAGLVALDRASGRPLWRWRSPTNPAFLFGCVASPVLAEGLVVAATVDGTLHAFPAPG